MLLGADTIRPVLNRLLPDIDVWHGPASPSSPMSGRRSDAAAGALGRGRLLGQRGLRHRRADRRQRGGTAIVMGALSPRTRNAQVEMFQSGEVDYLVATDAIGMGLNMDVNHVWFASLRKFDGRQLRPLRDVELAQIAGRAGRHMNDGTFGTTIDVGGIDEETIEAVENHRFDPCASCSGATRPRLPVGPCAARLVERGTAARRAAAGSRAGRPARPPDVVTESDFLPRLHAPRRVSCSGKCVRCLTSARP
jgi:ATP-dependent RNA helicase SUPV3L1/SUV3